MPRITRSSTDLYKEEVSRVTERMVIALGAELGLNLTYVDDFVPWSHLYLWLCLSDMRYNQYSINNDVAAIKATDIEYEFYHEMYRSFVSPSNWLSSPKSSNTNTTVLSNDYINFDEILAYLTNPLYYSLNKSATLKAFCDYLHTYHIHNKTSFFDIRRTDYYEDKFFTFISVAAILFEEDFGEYEK